MLEARNSVHAGGSRHCVLEAWGALVKLEALRAEGLRHCVLEA